MPWEHTGSKIAARHRERLAVVYVRQSTRQAVVGHQESTRLQYALVDRAVALGWEASRVVLIDDDLGKSGQPSDTGATSLDYRTIRRTGQPARVIAIADKAQQRLCRRFRRMLAEHKPAPKVAVAVARELAGFLWAALQRPEVA